MTTELICDYCQKEIDEGAYHVAEQDPDDPAIVFNFHPDCYDLRCDDIDPEERITDGDDD